MTSLTLLALILLSPAAQDAAASQPSVAPVSSSTTKYAGPSDPQPANNPGLWVTTEDYPLSAMREGIEGVTRFRLNVSGEGLVTSCMVVRSSGDSALDEAACRSASERAKFEPARDNKGRAVAGTYQTSVRWQLPDDYDDSFPMIPSMVQVTYIVETDGSFTNCKTVADGELGEMMGEAEDSCPPSDMQPIYDDEGDAVRKRVTFMTRITIEDVEPAEDAE